MLFQAEQTLFKVHRFMLTRESAFFKDMLSLPTSTSEGTDTAPLLVPDVPAHALSALLRLVYLRSAAAVNMKYDY